MTCEVTEGHCVSEEVLLQSALLLVKCRLLFLDVLLDKTFTIVIEVLENKCLISWIVRLRGYYSLWNPVVQGSQSWKQTDTLNLSRSSSCKILLQLLIVADDLFLVVLQCIEGVEEGHHGLGKHLSLANVNLNEECEGYVVEHVLSQSVESIHCQVLEELRLLSQMAMKLKMIDKLLCARVLTRRDGITHLVEANSIGYGLPLEVKIGVRLRWAFLPLM